MILLSPSFHHILVFGNILAIPLVSSCLRTTNNAGGDFVPDPRSGAKTFTTTNVASTSQTAATKSDNIVTASGTQAQQQKKISYTPQISGTASSSVSDSTKTSSSTDTTAFTALGKGKGFDGYHGHHKGFHSDSRERKFKEHMKRYRSLFHGKTYQAKTFTPRGEAKENVTLAKRNESETSGGLPTSKANNNEMKKEKTVFRTTNGSLSMCSTCPEIMITTTDQLKTRCENWKAIQENFYMKMDPQTTEIKEKHTLNECFKTVICKEPHAIVRWFDYSMCDVHNSSKIEPSFELKCNGTHWTMHDFPVEAVTCAKQHSL